jgi:hypothetical protein
MRKIVCLRQLSGSTDPIPTSSRVLPMRSPGAIPVTSKKRSEK